jgi:hypothetical protein
MHSRRLLRQLDAIHGRQSATRYACIRVHAGMASPSGDEGLDVYAGCEKAAIDSDALPGDEAGGIGREKDGDSHQF